MDTESGWDVFICHASEDKEEFVRPLANLLSSFGARVWYDEFTIGIGDSLSRSIDKGLAASRFGLVVLSPAFLKKDWPEYELRGLVARELGRDKLILPIWNGVEREDVLKYSPPLADKIALKACDLTIKQIAIRVLEVVRPDLLTKLLRRLAFRERWKNSQIIQVNPNRVAQPPIRHKSLTPDLLRRLRLIRATMLEVFPGTMITWINAFRRDSHPSHEIAWWEHFVACYIEYISVRPTTPEIRKHIFSLMMSHLNGESQEVLAKESTLASHDFDFLLQICDSALPVYEVAEEEAPDSGEDDPISIAADPELDIEDLE
jgi:hypothetical protein